MEYRYKHLLSPLKIGNVILKNRIYTGKAISQELQGPENFPAESTVKWVEDMSKTSAIVTTAVGMFPEMVGKTAATSEFDLSVRQVASTINRMIERVHAHGSIVCGTNQSSSPMTWKISDVRNPDIFPYGTMKFGPVWDIEKSPEIPAEEIPGLVKMMVEHAVFMKNVGFDSIFLYNNGAGSIISQSLSARYNQRTDKYGGSAENRVRLCKEYLTEVKRICGKDFIVNCMMQGEEDGPGGYTTDDFMTYCRELEGLVDIVTVSGPGGMAPGFNKTIEPEHGGLKYAKIIKDSGLDMVTCCNGGFRDFDLADKYIADGWVDMIGIARPIMADPDFSEKLYAGADNFAPCISCDKCHGGVCSVNPKNGLAHVFPHMFDQPDGVKKVAVIGGGPAGMYAAMAAADRGNDVTIFEEKSFLGGQLIHADYIPTKFVLKRLLNYIVGEVSSRGNITVKLNTKATAELIDGKFDAVITACGSQPNAGPVKGGEKAIKPMDVFGRESEIGKKVVVIGGAMVGTEIAFYLASLGREVTCITRRDVIAYDVASHSKFEAIKWYNSQENPKVIANAETTEVGDGYVVYTDKDGASHKIECDSVVFSAGSTPRIDECYGFAGTAPRFFVAGECNRQADNMCGMGMAPVPTDRLEEVTYDIRHCTFSGYMAGCNI